MLLTVIAGVALAPVVAAAQSTDSPTPPRTPWGQADLQGVWDFRTITPLERPDDLAEKEFLTAEEAADMEERTRQRRAARDRSIPGPGRVGAYNQFWFDSGTTVVGDRRTALIVDPPNGRIPPLTPEAEQRFEARRAYRRDHPADSWEDRGLSDRCLFTTGLPIVPSGYNNNVHLFQTPDYVVMLIEMTHTLRIVPLDGRPHGNIRQWVGDSRGHWEGDTLVVETTNFHGLRETTFGRISPVLGEGIRGTGPNAHLVERFTRVSSDTIQYEFTVEDPETFTRPWTAVVPLTRTEAPLFEYACHEGNYGLYNILAGARAEEKAAAEAATFARCGRRSGNCIALRAT